MKPVEQTLFEAHSGDCHAACLASVLEIPLESIPKPTPQELADSEGWVGYLERVRKEVLNPIGLQDMNFLARAGDTDELLRPPGYAIGCAVSPRTGGYHAFVALDGQLVWDPHPQRDMGIGEIVEWTVFVALDPAKAQTNREQAHMNIYLLTRKDECRDDQFERAIVCDESPESALEWDLRDELKNRSVARSYPFYWHPGNVTVEQVGTALEGAEAGVLCAHWKAMPFVYVD